MNQRDLQHKQMTKVREEIKEEWDKITEDEILEYIYSMREHIVALIAINGVYM